MYKKVDLSLEEQMELMFLLNEMVVGIVQSAATDGEGLSVNSVIGLSDLVDAIKDCCLTGVFPIASIDLLPPLFVKNLEIYKNLKNEHKHPGIQEVISEKIMDFYSLKRKFENALNADFDLMYEEMLSGDYVPKNQVKVTIMREVIPNENKDLH